MAEQSAAASSQWEEEDLLVPLMLVNGINTAADIQPALSLGAVWVVCEGWFGKQSCR